MYTIDAKSDDNYFIVIRESDKKTFIIAKKGNDLEAVKKLIGLINIKEIILDKKEQKQ